MRTLTKCLVFLIIGLCFFSGATAEELCAVNGTGVPRLSEQIDIGDKALSSIGKLIDELKQFPNLRSVSWHGANIKDIMQLMEAFPRVSFDCTFTRYKEEYNTGMKYASIPTSKINDRDLRNFLTVMPHLRKLDIFSYRASMEELEKLFEDYPNISFGCRVPIGPQSVRTDATAFSTLKGGKTKRFDSEHFDRLRYCPNLLAIDLGHNKIDDVSFLKYFPHLKVLILADNQISDLSELVSYVPELEYVELFLNNISDISPFTSLKHLRHLNVAHNQIEDLSPILEMPQLIRCWVAYNRFPEEQKQMLIDAMPDTRFEFTTYSSTAGGWRWRPSRYYEAIHKMFHSYTYIPLPD